MVRQHGPQLQLVYEASKEHATRSKGTQEALKHRSRRQELPAIPPQLTSELITGRAVFLVVWFVCVFALAFCLVVLC